MDTKTSISYKKIPDLVAYKKALQSSSDYIIDTKKLSFIPSSGAGPYGDGYNTDLTAYIQDPNPGSFLHPDSVYATCDVEVQKSDGSPCTTAIFESSANDMISRLSIRGLKSRVSLCDNQFFNIWSAMVDRLSNPDYYKGGDFSRGQVQEISASLNGTGTTIGSASYGGASRGAQLAADLGSGKMRYKIDLSKAPFFSNKMLFPLAVSGGLEAAMKFDSTENVFAVHAPENTDAKVGDNATAAKYKITNFRIHATVSYMSREFMAAINNTILNQGLSYPFSSYIGLQPSPQSTSETIRITNSLEHLRSLFVVHRHSDDIDKLAKYSHSHFPNARVEEIQAIAGGVTIPSLPLVCCDNTVYDTNYVRTTGAAIEELSEAAKTLGIYDKKKSYNRYAKDRIIATSTIGTAVGTNTVPVLKDVGNWAGCSILALKMESGTDPFSSVYNRSSTSANMPTRKTDLNLNIKYGASPTTTTANIFLLHSNVAKILVNGQIIPEQLTF